MKYSQDYSFSKGRRGISKDEKTFKITPVEGGAGLALAALFLGRNKKKTSNVKPPPSKPKFSNVQVPVGKPKQTRKPQTLKEQKKPFTRTKRMEGLKRSVIEGINAARKKFRDEKIPEGFPNKKD